MLDLVLVNPAAAKPKAPDAKATPGRSTLAASTTLERFQFAAQFAKLAAGNDMIPLSLGAVRLWLAGGPPVVPMAIDENQNSGFVRRNNGNDQEGQIELQVEAQLAALNVLWQHGPRRVRSTRRLPRRSPPRGRPFQGVPLPQATCARGPPHPQRERDAGALGRPRRHP